MSEAYSRAGLLKRLIVLFWALWITVVAAMNVMELFKALGILPSDWALASGNYAAIVHVTKVYGTPAWVDRALLTAALAWESVCAVLCWRAFRQFRGSHPRRWPAVYVAWGALFLLFAGFILSDEIFHAYKMEGDHRGIAILLLVSLLTLTLLPDRVPK